ATVVQEVKKSFSNQKVASSIPCRSVLEQDTEPLIAPDVQCKCKMCIHCKSHICKSLWIKASAKCKCNLHLKWPPLCKAKLHSHSSHYSFSFILPVSEQTAREAACQELSLTFSQQK